MGAFIAKIWGKDGELLKLDENSTENSSTKDMVMGGTAETIEGTKYFEQDQPPVLTYLVAIAPSTFVGASSREPKGRCPKKLDMLLYYFTRSIEPV